MKQTHNVKIKAVDGISFFYCGTVKGFLDDIKRLEKETKQDNIALINRYKTRLLNIDKVYEDRYELAKAKGKIKNEEKYLADLKKAKAKELEQLPILIETLKQESKIHLLNREVKEIIKGISPDEIPCKIIEIQGHERGKFWTIKEYQGKERICKEDEEGEE